MELPTEENTRLREIRESDMEQFCRWLPGEVSPERVRELVDGDAGETFDLHAAHLNERLWKQRQCVFRGLVSTEIVLRQVLGECGEYFLRLILDDCLRENAGAYEQWNTEEPYEFGTHQLTFSPTGNISIEYTKKRFRWRYALTVAEFDVGLLDSAGNLFLLDTTTSLLALCRKFSKANKRRTEGHLDELRKHFPVALHHILVTPSGAERVSLPKQDFEGQIRNWMVGDVFTDIRTRFLNAIGWEENDR